MYFLVAVVLVGSGCSEPDIPRTKQEIHEDILSLPALYRSPSGVEIVAPGNAGEHGLVIFDEDSGELAWRVWECTNPTCPGRTDAGPFQFICPRAGIVAGPAGTIEVDSLANSHSTTFGCPKCVTPTGETQQYISHVRPYVSPDSAAHQAELETELQTRIDNVNLRLGISTSFE